MLTLRGFKTERGEDMSRSSYRAHEFLKRAKNEEDRPKKPKYDKVYCIYHDKDFDGIMSAAIIVKEYPHVKLIPYDYGYDIDLDGIEVDSAVFIVDCCLSEGYMIYLERRTNLFLFDHHYSSYNNPTYKKYKGRRQLNCAACILVFDYFHPFGSWPIGLKMVGWYDVWNQDSKEFWDTQVIPFQYGLQQYALDPTLLEYQKILCDDMEFVNTTIESGKAIFSYITSQAATAMKKFGYTTELTCDGKTYCVLVINRQLVSSDFFKSKLNKSKHDFCVGYQEKEGVYTYSLRSWKGSVDVNKIAKAMHPTGGGHKYAAGFTLDYNIFNQQN